jgi:hypothetical protein
MIEVTTREFTRRFPKFRALAARGESIRVASPDGAFIFSRESNGIRAGEFLKRLEASRRRGVFDEGGADAVEKARSGAKPARSPWA